MVNLDWRAVAVGGAVAIAIAVPVNLVGQLVLPDPDAEQSSLVFVFFAVSLVAFALGGFVAASKRPDSPLTHGATAAVAAYLLVQAIGIVLVLARGDSDDLNPVAYVFNALLASSAGLVGALIANRRSTRST